MARPITPAQKRFLMERAARRRRAKKAAETRAANKAQGGLFDSTPIRRHLTKGMVTIPDDELNDSLDGVFP